MSAAAIKCPSCGSTSVRRSRRANMNEMPRMLMGVYPFRCNSCKLRFWDSVWLFSIWKWAKCPRCLNVNLVDWPKRHMNLSLWTQLLLAMGAQKHRCRRCRNNFVSFRPRVEEFDSEIDEGEDVAGDVIHNAEAAPARPTAAEKNAESIHQNPN